MRVPCVLTPLGTQGLALFSLTEETEAQGGRAAGPRSHSELQRQVGSQVHRVRWPRLLGSKLAGEPSSPTRALLAQAPVFVLAAPPPSPLWPPYSQEPGDLMREPAKPGAAPGWSWSQITINTVSSSVCPSLHAVPRGKGWPRANIRRCVPPSPSPAGSHARRAGYTGGLAAVCRGGLGFRGEGSEEAAPWSGCLPPTPSWC